MSDDLIASQLPNDPPRPWLARNRKMVILTGLVLILGIAAVSTYVWPRQQMAVNTTNSTTLSNTSTAPTTTARPTFQRSTISNTTAAPPARYQPPNQQDLRQAINQLQQNTNQ